MYAQVIIEKYLDMIDYVCVEWIQLNVYVFRCGVFWAWYEGSSSLEFEYI
jgi:hypothetical protein